MVTEDYCSFEIAKLLKEKEFYSEDCFAFYNENGDIGFLQTFGDMSDYLGDNSIDAPTHQMALKWLRNEKNIFIDVCIPASGLKCYVYDIYYVDPKEETWDIILPDKKLSIGKKEENYSTFEEAAEAGMLYVLKNLI